MMNFKKNQNNAVCSMDCKDCPNGASQPNPMDDSKFEKSIAMLHNWVMLEAIREDHPKERIVMVILPGTGGELLTEAGSRDIFEDVYIHFCTVSIAVLISSAQIFEYVNLQTPNIGHCSLLAVSATHSSRESQSLLSSERKSIVLLQSILNPPAAALRASASLREAWRLWSRRPSTR